MTTAPEARACGKQAGYEAIELAAMPGMSDHLSSCLESQALLTELKQKIADSGLPVLDLARVK